MLEHIYTLETSHVSIGSLALQAVILGYKFNLPKFQQAGIDFYQHGSAKIFTSWTEGSEELYTKELLKLVSDVFMVVREAAQELREMFVARLCDMDTNIIEDGLFQALMDENRQLRIDLMKQLRLNRDPMLEA